MPESPIRKLVPYSEVAKKKGRKVYHLNIGQPDIKTPELAIKKIKNLDLKVLEYSHSAGNESYRRKLSDYYKGIGIDAGFDEMLITEVVSRMVKEYGQQTDDVMDIQFADQRIKTGE